MDPRPRNTEGQFSPESGGGLDSSTMQAAYSPEIIAQRQQRNQALLASLRKKIPVTQSVEETVPSGASDTILEARFSRPETYLLKRLISFSRSFQK